MGAAASEIAGPPSTPIFLSLPSAKKPTERESGDEGTFVSNGDGTYSFDLQGIVNTYADEYVRKNRDQRVDVLQAQRDAA